MILAWLKGWKQRNVQAAFERGFGWAMTEHYLHGVSPEDIEGQIDGQPPHAFDRGAYAALTKIYSPR